LRRAQEYSEKGKSTRRRLLIQVSSNYLPLGSVRQADKNAAKQEVNSNERLKYTLMGWSDAGDVDFQPDAAAYAYATN
jgi:hypothetical protein